MLWNDGWAFALLPLGSGYPDMKRAETRHVVLPHDWLIEDTDDLYRSGDGWYVKELFFDPASDGEKTVYLDFDGVYMDAEVLLNGQLLCTHRYGYTAFLADLTGKLLAGRNEIAVHVRHQSPNSRWYSGAGIFRDVRLLLLPRRHWVPFGCAVNTRRENGKWLLSVTAEISSPGDGRPAAALRDAQGNLLFREPMAEKDGGAFLEMVLENVRPWSPEDPALYELTLTLGEQTESVGVGFRETRFDPDRGFFLNGRHLKLHGVCLHHDQGALGAAFYEKAARRQLETMRAMGANAVRTAHNPPARQFLDLCDRMGLLVIDELYDMWEEPKTPFDNARFFPETYRQDVAEWVRRDRRHPSVILWSIGNEIHDMHASPRGRLWTERLTEEVRSHDPCHASVTFGSNYMPWEGAQQCADAVKIPGYNYAEKYYAPHHARHPDWVIYGSETGSHLQSRGVYHFPMDAHILSEEDRQCSALLNSMTSWGTQNLPAMLADDLNTPYSMGQFIWAGIDYIGEPTPYHTRCCYFGQTDTACFPKDSYYFYQAMWTEKPMIHIGMIWDWNEGQLIDVPVMTNGAFAELFFNGRSLGRKRVDRRDPAFCLPRWQVAYHPGTLLARAYDEAGNVLCETEKRSFSEAASIRLICGQAALSARSRDLAFIEASVLDEAGRPVENAVDRLRVSLSGPGVLLGMDNGDSTDPDPFQTDSKRLFSGRLLMIVGPGDEAGEIRVRVTGKGLQPAECTLRVVPQTGDAEPLPRPAAGEKRPKEDGVFVRRIDLLPLTGTHLTPESPCARFRVQVLPQNAFDQPLTFRVTNAQGVDVPFAQVRREGDVAVLTARGDGKMYLRATASNGAEHARILSVREIEASGFGPVALDPYGFIAGALYDDAVGEITPGNERGVSFARDGFSAVGFSHVDFGPVGSDEITLPVFALDDQKYEITLWDGHPEKGGKAVARLPYQKPSVWNVYQAETYRLPQVLRGERALYFSMDRKVHLQGFSFARQQRTDRLIRAADADEIYGDSFSVSPDAVRDIGNNVTLTFTHFFFRRQGPVCLLLEGATKLDVNTVMVRVTGEDGGAVTSECAFEKTDGFEKRTFTVQALKGMCAVSFVFLPGCQFDFRSFQFFPDETQQERKDHGRVL